MRSSLAFALLLLSLVVPQAVKADTTIRYKSDVKLGALLPPSVTAQANSQKSLLPPVTMIQIKGAKGFSNASFTSSLIDLTRQEITLIDPTNKLFATVSTKDYVGEMSAAMPAFPPVPPAVEAILETIKADTSCRKTGRMDTILGAQVEEEECTVSLSLPVPVNLPLPPGLFPPGQPVTILKLVLQRWNATPAEIARVPALKELLAYNSSSAQLMDPTAMMQQTLAKFPVIGQNLSPMFEPLMSNKSPLLKAHIEIYVPVVGQIMPLLQAQGKVPPGFDPNASLAEIDMVATELSSAPIDDSVFKVPSDYHATPLADLLKTLIPNNPKPQGRPLGPQALLPQDEPPEAAQGGGQGAGQGAGQGPGQRPPAYDKAIFQNPVPSAQLAFLNNFSGMESDKAMRDKDFRKLLKDVVPNCTFHYGRDMSILDALDTVIKGSRQPVQIRDGRYVMVSGQNGPFLLGRGFLWFDLKDGIALGGFYFHPTNGEPTPTVNIFSAQVKEAALEMNQLPPAFAEDLGQWAYDERIPDITTRYFITGNKKKIVLQHDEDYCAPTDGSIAPEQAVCQQMNADAADIDVDAADFVDQTGHATNATAWTANRPDFVVWVGQRDATCRADRDPLACRVRLTREHARLIIHRTPPLPPHK